MNNLFSSFILAQEAVDAGPIASVVMVLYLAFIVLMIASMWKVFTKAGKPGWASIVPIYNVIVMLEIAGKPIWWILLFFIPLVNIVIALLVVIDFAKAFGKGTGYALGLIFLGFIFYPMLAFGDAQYQGA
ncbi:MAG: DUF5684 domain-containing protein [Planctomycetaceae bacterium]|jgi:hypothetical protein|nr:DUF5684 domain-containing protein [Planctomycetaceae bacterium]